MEPCTPVQPAADLCADARLAPAPSPQHRAGDPSAEGARARALVHAAHELKAPAAAMLGLAELLATDADEPLPERQVDCLRHLMTAGRHLMAMIDDLLDYSRLQAGHLPVRLGPLDLNAIAADALAIGATAAHRRGLSISLQPSQPAVMAQADPKRVLQILLNLLSNATHYNRPGGVVELRVGPGPQVTVSDSGEGMDAQQLARLFQPFDRLGREQRDSDSDSDGVGVGLALSRGLAELMGGQLRIDSQPGQGTTATLSLCEAEPVAAPHRDPAADAEPASGTRPAQPLLRPVLRSRPTSAPSSTPVPPLRQTMPALGSGCLLCIDANPVHARLLQSQLEARGVALQVRQAATAQEGLALARVVRPRAVLLELTLPDADGLDLLRQLRSDPLVGDVPVAIVSGAVNPSLLRQARALGAKACWPKPLDLDRLDGWLGDLLRDAPVPATAAATAAQSAQLRKPVANPSCQAGA